MIGGRLEPVVTGSRMNLVGRHIAQDLESANTRFVAQDLDQGISVGHRRGFVRADNGNVMAGLAEGNHAVGNPRGGIDNHEFEILIEFA